MGRLRPRVVTAVVVALLALGLTAATALGAQTNFSGSVSASGTVTQTFSFAVSSPGQVSSTMQWTTQSAVLTLAIVDPTGKQVALNSSNANPKTVTYQATLTGTYKVRVKAKSGSSSYTGSATYPGVSVPQYAGQVGGGASGHAEIYPSGLTVGPDGTVYVADTGNDQVKAYAPNGAVLWTVGTRGSRTVGNFSNPRDIAYLGGKLYVDDTGNNRVQVLDAATHTVTGAWSYKFPSTLGISAGVDGNGTDIILVSEDTSNAVAIFSPDGTLKCTISVPGNAGKAAQPRDAATDANGDVYVAAYQQDRIVEFSPPVGNTCSQNIVRTWGTHGSSNTQLIRPYGVDLDSAGHVYVADSDNERIQEFTSTGGYLSTYGASVSLGGDFQQLRRVAVGPNGDVYGADLWGEHIDRFTSPTAAPAQVFGGQLPADGYFNEPSGLTFDSAGNMFVADSVNQRIQEFAHGATGADWTYSAKWGARGWGNGDLSGFNWPRDIVYEPNSGHLWVADTKNNRLLEFTTAGTSTSVFVGSAASMHWPYAIEAYNGQLIIADTFANRVASWSPTGTQNWSVTSANGLALKAPYDVAVANGVLYVADSANKRIVELDPATGAYIGSFGTGNLHSPQGVAVDPVSGSIWVADTSYNRLVQFSSTGQFIQTVGKLGSGNAQFNHPAHLDVHVDVSGHAYLYVADNYNDRIQILDLNEN